MLEDGKPVRDINEHIHEAEDIRHMLMCSSICDDLKALILLLSLKINQETKQQQSCGTSLSMQSSCLSLSLYLGHSIGFLIHPHIS